MPSVTEALRILDVSMAYGSKTVVHNIDFAVKSGEFFGLIGLNGAGKTTLIKAILDLMTPQSGEVKIMDHAAGSKLGKSALAYLPERFDPPWFLSGMEFIKFSMKLYGRRFNPADAISGAESLALDPAALKRKVQTYSKGMRQKLGLLATVMTDCQIMILDEPMSGLDPLARTLVKDMLVKTRSKGKTIFLSSHILADMDEICDRVAVLDQGVIKYTGTPTQMKKETQAETLERAFLHYVEKRMAA